MASIIQFWQGKRYIIPQSGGQRAENGDESCNTSDQSSTNDLARPTTTTTQDSTDSINNNQNENSSTDCNNNIPHDQMASEDLSQPSMRRLKKMGWYWGSISPEFATKLLENEQDGSFLVRDSSSECYIFSMTFKLDGQIHHARIEHSRGKCRLSRLTFVCCTRSHSNDLCFIPRIYGNRSLQLRTK